MLTSTDGELKVDRELKVDYKIIEQNIKNLGFAFVHCPEYKTRQEIRSRLVAHNPKWICKSMVNKEMPGNSIFVCRHCKEGSPDHMTTYKHFDSPKGPDSSMSTCPKCRETNHRDGDDDFVLYYPDKNMLVVTLEWKGKKYYTKRFKTATVVSSVGPSTGSSTGSSTS